MRLFLLCFTLLFLSGCISIQTTGSLIDLQTGFGELVQTEEKCLKPNSRDETCLIDFTTMYGDIESQAVDAIEELKGSVDTGDRQVSIALYRLAAYASLKADTNNAATYADAGSQLCADLANAAPPRDCALLKVVGQYEVVEAFDTAATCLFSSACTPGSSAEDVVSGYCEIYSTLVKKTNAAKQQSLLPKNVSDYLDRQVKGAREAMHSLAFKLTPEDPADQPAKPCECVNLDATDPAFTADCGNVQVSARMGTFKAICISDRLAEDPPACPKF
jgi:hypothetical protein